MALAGLTALGGCSTSLSPLNDELAVGPGSRAAGVGGGEFTFKPLTRSFNINPTTERPFAVEVPEKSVVGVSRDNWEIMPVTVPNDRIAHQPIYTHNLHENTEPPRNRGQFPTTRSSLDLSVPESGEMQVLEAIEAPFAAVTDIVLFLPRAIMNQPWETTRTGSQPYRRAPEMRGSVHPLKLTPKRTTKPDPAAAPVQVPIGDYQPLPANP